MASPPRSLLTAARSHLARRRRARASAAWPYPVARLDPPPPEPGCEPAPPDFVGVGVQKAGTTWWYGLLANHPGVHPRGRPKELHFFDHFARRPMTSLDAEQYSRWFARPDGTRAGEWTPRYLYDWWVPPLLDEAAPGARVLVMLRDPVDRYVSQLARDTERGAPDAPVVSQDAFHRGLYGRQLEWLLQHVDAARVLLLQYERCRDDPAGQLARTYEFCGLEPSHRPDQLTRHVGPRHGGVTLPQRIREALAEAYQEDLTRLDELAQGLHTDLDLGLWPSHG